MSLPVIILPLECWYTDEEDVPKTDCAVMAHLMGCEIKAHPVGPLLEGKDSSECVVPPNGWLLVWQGSDRVGIKDLPTKSTLLCSGQSHIFKPGQGALWLPGWEA